MKNFVGKIPNTKFKGKRFPQQLPKAYGGCRCICHRTGAKHVVVCCTVNGINRPVKINEQ